MERAQKYFPSNTCGNWIHSKCFLQSNLRDYFSCFRRVLKNRFIISVCPSALMEKLDFHCRILKIFNIWLLQENLPWKLKFNLNLRRITGNFHEDQYKFMIIFRSFLLRMRNISDTICREYKKKISSSKYFFLKSFRLRDLWENMVQPDRPQMTI